MMGGMIWGMLYGLLLGVLSLLGFAYIIWVLAAKESGGIKLTGQIIAGAIAVLAIIMFLYGTYGGIRGGGVCGMGMGMGPGMMGGMKGQGEMEKWMKSPQMKKWMEEYQKKMKK